MISKKEQVQIETSIINIIKLAEKYMTSLNYQEYCKEIYHSLELNEKRLKNEKRKS